MSLTSQIGSSDVSFKLSQKIVSALAEKFAFKFEDGWDTISSRPIESIQKRIRRDKRRANPTSSIKHARTGFSYFTQKERPVCQAEHPEATFGELSRYVSEKWKALSPESLAEFKAMEIEDKVRYQNERAAMLAVVSVSTSETGAVLEEPVKEKKVKKEKTIPVVVSDVLVPVPKVKSAKASKAVKVEVVAAAAVTSIPSTLPVEAKTTKPKSAKKEITSTEVKPVVATPVVATPASTSTEAKSAKTAKVVKDATTTAIPITKVSVPKAKAVKV